jgi:hypothetical protein
VTIEGFKECCISNAMDGREDEEEVRNAGSEGDKYGNGEVDDRNGKDNECENKNGNDEEIDTDW